MFLRNPCCFIIHFLLNQGSSTRLLLLPSFVEKKRELLFFKVYFKDFYEKQTWKVQKKILWTLKVVETVDRIPEIYFKHLENTEGLYEIRVQLGSNIFRIFCFFDIDKLVVVGQGFQKKTEKTPTLEIERAEKIKKEYYEEKKLNKP